VVHQYRVAILGATGAVGQEFLGLLQRRNFPISAVRLLASPRSMGRTFRFRNAEIPVQVVSDAAFDGVHFAFFSAGSEASQRWAPVALERGAIVIDNSSAFRMDPQVPLVIPEINWHHVTPSHRLFPVGNCTGIILMMAVGPLRKFGRIKRIVASTYQSASGAGARAMQELADQTRAIAQGRQPEVDVFPHQIALNLFSHNTPINEQGYNQEEWKVIQEVRKTLEMPDLAIDITCIRVPVMRAHSISANVEFDGPAPSVSAMREAIESASGLRLVDDRENNTFPMPTDAAGVDDVLVGRLRQDAGNPNAVSLFTCGDQLLKGAALNGVQIAEALIAEARVPAPVA
jgi:aspartate-semialdehyde dehydrogenase